MTKAGIWIRRILPCGSSPFMKDPSKNYIKCKKASDNLLTTLLIKQFRRDDEKCAIDLGNLFYNLTDPKLLSLACMVGARIIAFIPP